MASLASTTLLRGRSQSAGYVCARCVQRTLKPPSAITKRWVGQKYLDKFVKAEMEWHDQAAEIRAGRKKSMLSILEERGLVQATTHKREKVDDLLTSNRIGAYVGIDPTAPALHVGHLLPLMSLFWMYVHGYKAFTIIGGATAKIGDPTDRLKSRNETSSAVRTMNMTSMHYQLKKLWQNVEAYGARRGYKWEWAWRRGLLNNNAWFNKLPLLELLQVLGPGMRMGTMLSRETVKNKMEKGDGMSFAEFTYPIMQAWDWWHLCNTLDITMQIGGSDQYGNIVAGIDAVNYITAHHPNPAVRDKNGDRVPFGLTSPLLTTAAGAKFGKSAGNAVWLGREQTSPLELYNYFVMQADADVARYLRLLTFVPLAEIDALVAEHARDPARRRAQHRLAAEVVEMVHGLAEAELTQKQHALLYRRQRTGGEDDGVGGALVGGDGAAGDDEAALTAAAAATGAHLSVRDRFAHVTLNNAPGMFLKLPHSLVHKKSIGRILFAAGLAESASEGHRLAASRSVYVGAMPDGGSLKGSGGGGGGGGRGGAQKKEKTVMRPEALSYAPVALWYPEETARFLIEGKLLILRRGKHNVRVIEVVPDEEWRASGLRYVGERKLDTATAEERLQKDMKKTYPGKLPPWVVENMAQAKRERRAKKSEEGRAGAGAGA